MGLGKAEECRSGLTGLNSKATLVLIKLTVKVDSSHLKEIFTRDSGLTINLTV
jgi:hypothetical protein